MQRPLNRILEASIVLAILLVVLSQWSDRREQRILREHSIECATMLNQAIWDRFGPGAKTPYMELFGQSNSPNSFRDKINEFENYAQSVGQPWGFVAVPGAPQGFQDRLNVAADIIGCVTKVLEGGPFIAAPSEIYFSTNEYAIMNFLSVQLVSKAMQHLAWRNWTGGDKAKAVEYAKDNVRLGDSLRYGPALIEQLIGFAVKGIALNSFNGFAWTDPGKEENRLILQTLMDLHPENWDASTNLEYLLFPLTDWNPPNESTTPNDLAAAVLLREAPADPPTKAASLLRQAGMIPKKKLRFDRVVSLLGKWTTKPAMKKRAKKLPAVYYKEDGFLSEQAAHRFPPLLYAASRVSQAAYNKNYFSRMESVKGKALALIGAYWARCYRDEHNGVWPTKEEFRSQCPVKDQVDMRIIEAANTEASHTLLWINSYVYKLLAQQFMVFFNQSRNDKDCIPDPDTPGQFYLRCVFNSNEAGKEYVAWKVACIKAFAPFVENVTLKMGNDSPFWKDYIDAYGIGHPGFNNMAEALAIQIKLPKKTYWIYHRGPDGVWDDMGDIYDPSNGTNSKGDIVQLAGWE
ncbi:MAG: hypothetical protein AB1656_11075 [Candidatus Omnitrophota bacterium]